MIARLRKKFILITMGSVILVLSVLMGFINVANFIKMDQSANKTLAVLMENKGSFPEDAKHPPDKISSTDAAQGAVRRPQFSPEAPYETRYFSVEISSSGDLVSANTGKIAAVSTSEAVSLAQTLDRDGKISGYSGNYKYLSKSTESGTLYLFLDCTRDLNSVQDFLSSSFLVSLFGILAVFLLVVALSKRAIRPVAESYEKQKQFITNAGHEIKTPLAIIDSCTEVLELEQGQSKWTSGIRGQVERLTALTQSLVSLARMDEGSVDLPMTEFSLSDAVRDTLEPFVLMAESQHLALRADIQPDLRYRGSEQALRQLCSILADNAVKYALPDSEIRFTLFRKGRKLLLTCENAAEDLKPGDLSILFDRFYRGDASRSSQRSGYGIGLSMAQSIAAAHGGRIEAHSDDGHHLTLSVRL